MASFWGISWGGSWGSSWGTYATGTCGYDNANVYDVNYEYDTNACPVFIEVDDPPQLAPAGHWKHLFKPAQDAVPPLKGVRFHSRLQVVRPETTWGREDTGVVVRKVTARVRVSTTQVLTGATAVTPRVSFRSRVARPRLKAGASVFLGRVGGRSAAFGYAAACGSVAVRGVKCSVYVEPLVLKTVQNLPEEILLALM